MGRRAGSQDTYTYYLNEQRQSIASTDKIIDSFLQNRAGRGSILLHEHDFELSLPTIPSNDSSPKDEHGQIYQDMILRLMKQKDSKRKEAGCQTLIDTETFIQIVNFNHERLASMRNVGLQVTRFKDDTSFLTKKKGLHVFDVGQCVDQYQIKREFALRDIEMKNKRILEYFE